MMRDLLLPASIALLAGAIFVHAVLPARADVPPDPPVYPAIPEIEPTPPAPPSWGASSLPPECRPIRLGTRNEYERAMGEMYAAGRTSFTVIGSGLVCGWR